MSTTSTTPQQTQPGQPAAQEVAPSQANQPQVTQSTPSQPNQPTAQEILQSLEREYQDRNRELTATRESLSKSQEQVIAAQEASFRAFQLLSANKERYLVNIIAQHQGQVQNLSQELSKTKQLCNALVQQLNAARTAALPTAANAVATQPAVTNVSTAPVANTSVPQVPAREDNVSV